MKDRKLILTLVFAVLFITFFSYVGTHANKKFLQKDLELEFEGVVIKKIQRKGTRLILDRYGRFFEAEGILNGQLIDKATIGDTLIKFKGNKCVLKRTGKIDTLEYLYLKGY